MGVAGLRFLQFLPHHLGTLPCPSECSMRHHPESSMRHPERGAKDLGFGMVSLFFPPDVTNLL